MEQEKTAIDRLMALKMSQWGLIRKMSGFGFKEFAEDPQAILFDEGFMAAIVYLFKKEENPEFKHAEALDMTYVEAINYLGLDKIQEEASEDSEDPKA